MRDSTLVPAALASTRKGGTQNYRELLHGRQGLVNVRIEEANGIMQLGSAALSLGSTLFFVLFLRAVAVCMDSQGCVAFINAYLFFFFMIAAGTAFFFITSHGLPKPELLAMIGLGWLACLGWYVMLVISVRWAIGNYMRANAVG